MAKRPVVKYPEHEKLKALDGKKEAVQNFLDWLYDGANLCVADVMIVCENCEENEEGCLCRKFHGEERLHPVRMTREVLMAKHFEIDLRKIDDEKRAMLDEIRASNARR